MMNALEAARWWIKRYGFWPLPVNWKEKGATLKGWPELRLTLDTVGQYFNGEPQNISLLMGDPENLTDVDIDCAEARYASLEYLPPTGLTWGRRSNPASHHLYFTDPMAVTAKFLDPVFEKENPGDACLIELRCRTKEGKLGFPVVAPPSMHPSGEPYEFAGSPGQPAKVQGAFLGERTRLIAAASMLGRHARQGLCHETFIALAGMMARGKWDLEEAQRFVRAIYRVLWKDAANLSQANADVDSTYQHYDDGAETTGLTRLGGLLDERVFKRLKEWLGFEWQDGSARQQQAPKKGPRILPAAHSFDTLRTLVIPYGESLIEGMVQAPGLILGTGESKSGKTVLFTQMAMCCANGLHLFDNYVTRQAPGLVVEWDDRRGASSLKAFEELSRASRPGQPLAYSVQDEIDPDFNLAAPEFAPWLRSLILEHKARFVVLDSYTALRGFRSGNRGQDIVKVEAEELLLLERLAIETNSCLLLIHHTSKSAAHLDRHSRAAGSFAMTAVSEAQIIVERYRELGEEDPMRLVSVRGRHLPGMQMALRFRQESLDFDLVLDGPAAEEFPRLRLLLRAFRGKSFNAKDVSGEIGWAKTQVYALMSRLMGSGLIVKEAAAWAWNPVWTKTLERI